MAAAAPWIDESILLRAVPLTKLAAYEWNITTNQMVYNEAFFNIFGLDKNSEKAKDDIMQLTYVVDKEKIISETDRVVNYARSFDLTRDDNIISDEGKFNVDYRLIAKDGSIRWANTKGTLTIETVIDPMTNSPVRHIKLVGLLQDLTDMWNTFETEVQKRGEKTPKEIEHFMLVTEAIPHLVWANEPSGNITYFNSQWAAYTGFNLFAVPGWTWHNILHPDDAAETIKAWNTSLETGEKYEGQFRLRRHDGEYRWQLGLGVAIKGSNGQILRWFGTCTDIHDQKKLEQKSRETEIRLKLLLQSFPVSIWTIDLNGIITFLNEREDQRDNFGFDSNWVGRSLFEYLESKGYKDTNLTPLLKRALAGEKFTAEVEFQGYWFDVHYWPLKNEKGEMKGVAAVSVDVTIKKQAEKLAVSEQSALKIAQMKSEFLTTMSHEIRTPLNGIIGMSEFLAETTLTEEQSKYLDIIQNSGSHLLTLINDILDYSKIDSGKVELEPRDFTINTLLESSLQLFVPKLQSKKLSCSACVDRTLTKMILRGDEGRISQILINFISNSIKFTPPNGFVNVKVMPVAKNRFQELMANKKQFYSLIAGFKCERSISTPTEDGANIEISEIDTDCGQLLQNSVNEKIPVHVLFMVRDSGIGLSKEIEKKLFSPFVQAIGTHRQFGGTGLGLSICKKLTQLMSGEIGVVSTDGPGSIFWFAVPIMMKNSTFMGPHDIMSEFEPPKSPRSVQAQTPKDSPKIYAIKNRPNIMVVEDHPVNRKLMILTLQKLGCNVTAVSNGYEALDLLYKQHQNFDIIFMDCHMPGLDGYETSMEIRKHESAGNNFKPVPIIALTAAALPGDREKCLDAGMSDYITKPVTRQVIAASIKKWSPG